MSNHGPRGRPPMSGAARRTGPDVDATVAQMLGAASPQPSDAAATLVPVAPGPFKFNLQQWWTPHGELQVMFQVSHQHGIGAFLIDAATAERIGRTLAHFGRMSRLGQQIMAVPDFGPAVGESEPVAGHETHARYEEG